MGCSFSRPLACRHFSQPVSLVGAIVLHRFQNGRTFQWSKLYFRCSSVLYVLHDQTGHYVAAEGVSKALLAQGLLHCTCSYVDRESTKSAVIELCQPIQ